MDYCLENEVEIFLEESEIPIRRYMANRHHANAQDARALIDAAPEGMDVSFWINYSIEEEQKAERLNPNPPLNWDNVVLFRPRG